MTDGAQSHHTAGRADDIEIRSDVRPGDIGALIALHGTVYARERNFDRSFEAYVASTLGEFFETFDETRDRVWLVERAGRVLGSIALKGRSGRVAQLRYFVLHPELRGAGLGRRLIDDLLAWAHGRGYREIYLYTEGALEAAARLYRSVGFELVEESLQQRWGHAVVEQRYDLRLGEEGR